MNNSTNKKNTLKVKNIINQSLYNKIKSNMRKVLNKESIPLILITLLIFQNFLQTYISIFKYYDDFFVILFTISLPKIIKEKKYIITTSDKIILYSNIVVILIGLLGNIVFRYQDIRYITQDIIVYIKFYASLYYVRMTFINYKLTTNKKLYKMLKYIIIGFIIMTTANYLFDIFPHEIRYGIKSNQIIYSHPTYLCAVCVFIYTIISMSKVLLEKEKKISMLILLIIMITTLRSKAFVFALLAVILYYLIIVKNKKINAKIILISVVLSGIICINQINFYFFNTTDITARSALITTSIKLANDHFPLGAGFATFGSHTSKINYSPIYEKYNIDEVWGLAKDDGWFISDNFWPMIIGQFGYIGLIAYILTIIILFKLIQKQYKVTGSNYLYYAGIMSLIYLMISSTTESAFVNPLSIMFALVIGYSISEHPENNNNKSFKNRREYR